ncbi:MAG TPA: ubiquitin-like domain-containing protein [Lentibacillus sp.]|uniref:ubiquitin-like domain-containing protein n=1 Tax=Lentibacillus sp. TaxID=1925746 RepID=UPI002B4B72CE|nr:ubiquitin-like domain-containing protein [Lentibacillus sp.]HLR61155.1 ubiquitin-like domain-containing protein [Lentibacillus sp.]
MKIFSNLLPKRKWQWILSVVGVLALIAFSAFVIVETTKAEVAIVDNGEERTLKTHADTVNELLDEAGIAYEEHDALSHNTDAEIEDGMTITYETANKITVAADGKEKDYYTVEDTINEFLDETEISVSKHDETSHNKTAAIRDGMLYSIDRAFQVTINDGGDKQKVWTAGGTVGELLKENKITLDDSDKLKPAKDKKIKENNPITITRVKKVTDEVKETIDYKVEERKDNNLEKGKKKVIAEGHEGTLVKTFEITKENGKKVNKELVNKEVKQESEKRIVALGTKEKKPEQNLTTLSSESSNSTKNSSESGNNDNNSKSSSNNNSSSKVLQMTATAYSADCSGCSGITTTGIDLNNNPKKKVVAVDPSVIPLGSKVHVEGYGTAIAGDTGGNIGGKRIDLHVPTRADALSFGRKSVTVKILD